MIDNEKEALELIEALKEHLPMSAYATPPLVKAVRQQGTDIKVNDPVQIDSVLYLGDEGGVACSIGLDGGKTVVVTSITHLRIDSNHPLARRIEAYQLRRSQQLASSGEPSASPMLSRGRRIGRNDPCPCGSGKKYKKCCGTSK
jgi:preprotein translocase subunit SecA